MYFDFAKSRSLMVSGDTIADMHSEGTKTKKNKANTAQYTTEKTKINKIHTMLIENKEMIDKPSIFSDIPVQNASIGIMTDIHTKKKKVETLYEQMM